MVDDALITLPTITIRQPWAELVAAGIKPIENRPVGTRYRGWLGIHAGRQWAEGAMDYSWVRAAFGLGHASPGELHEAVDRLQRELPTRVLVAVVRLVHVHQAWPACCAPWGMATMKDHPARHWEWCEVHRLEPPLEGVAGRQYMFDLEVPLARLPAAVRTDLGV